MDFKLRTLIQPLQSRVAALLCIALALFMLAEAQHAAGMTRALRLHAPAHGQREFAATSAKSRQRGRSGPVHESATSKPSKHMGRPSKAAPALRDSHLRSKRGRKQRGPEVVADPIPMGRAGVSHPRRGAHADSREARENMIASRSHVTKEGEEFARSVRRKQDAAVETAARFHSKTPSPPAVARSVVATRGTVVSAADAAAGTEFVARGESRPEDNGEISVRSPNGPLVARNPNEAPVSGAPTAVGGLGGRPRVVSGFGAEVAAAPSSPASANAGSLLQVAPQDIPRDGDSLRAITEAAIQPTVIPEYTRSGKVIMPPPLKGSREVLVHQNLMADRDGLERIQNDRELNRLRKLRLLVSFPENESLRVNGGLPDERRYARPWTVKFAIDMGRAYYEHFGVPLQVNSAVRTVSYQLRLQRVNGNAAAVDGDGASPHLTGQAIDLAKRGMDMAQIAWMRNYLVPLIDAGKIDVEEEFQQACFHVSVYRSYGPVLQRNAVPAMQVAQVRTSGKAALRTANLEEENER